MNCNKVSKRVLRRHRQRERQRKSIPEGNLPDLSIRRKKRNLFRRIGRHNVNVQKAEELTHQTKRHVADIIRNYIKYNNETINYIYQFKQMLEEWQSHPDSPQDTFEYSCREARLRQREIYEASLWDKIIDLHLKPDRRLN